MFLKRTKVAEGWRRAEERKVWSGRRKDTRFNGEPERHGQSPPWEDELIFWCTREVVRDFLPKLAAQHRIDVWVRRLWKVGLGKRGHSKSLSLTPRQCKCELKVYQGFERSKEVSENAECAANGDILCSRLAPHGGACCLVMCRHEACMIPRPCRGSEAYRSV